MYPPAKLILVAVGPSPLRVMAAIRSVVPNLSLKDAKEIVHRQLPQTLLEDVDSRHIHKVQAIMRDAGATVELERTKIGVDPHQWLRSRVTVQQAEDAYRKRISDEQIAQDERLAQPFGYCHDDWCKLKDMLCVEDELWFFESPSINWEYMCGRQGYALVRNGKIEKLIITSMN